MIPRILVPPDARPTTLIATKGRPTALDERTLIPGTITTGPLEEKTQIPAGLPLDSIARVLLCRATRKFCRTLRRRSATLRRSQACWTNVSRFLPVQSHRKVL